MDNHFSNEKPSEAKPIIEARLEEIKSFNSREKRVTYSVIFSIVIIVLTSIASQTFSVSTLNDSIREANARLEQAITQADKRLDKALEDTEPDYALIVSSDEDNEDIMHFRAYLAAYDYMETRSYNVIIKADSFVEVHGQPGHFLGTVLKINEESMLNKLGVNRLGTVSNSFASVYKKGIFLPFAESYDGVTITKYAPIVDKLSISFAKQTCQDAVQFIKELEQTHWQIELKPIFTRIKEPAPFKVFDVKTESYLTYTCEELERKNIDKASF